MNVKNDYITRIQSKDSEKLEKWIDELDAELPALTNFILPGGHPSAAYLHLARNVCRRAERLTVGLSHKESIGSEVVVYLNRLSDLLFILARWINLREGVTEVKWGKE